MRFRNLEKITQELFCFNDFEEALNEITALNHDIRYLVDTIDKFSVCPEFSDSNSGITILNSVLKELKSIYIKKDLVSVLKSNKLSRSDLLTILTLLFDKIYYRKIFVSRTITHLS